MKAALLALAAVILTLALASTATAQCDNPTCAAEIITRATAQAQAAQWQAAQQATRQVYVQAAQATATAVAIESTRQAQEAQATRQAVEARATQNALDELERQRAATSTAQTIGATSTAQAIEIQATRHAQAAQATEAAHTAYQAAWQRAERQGQAVELFLYAALALALVGALVLAFRAYQAIRAIEQRAARQPAVLPQLGDVVIDAVVDYQEPGRGLSVTVIDNPDLVDRFEQYVMEHGI